MKIKEEDLQTKYLYSAEPKFDTHKPTDQFGFIIETTCTQSINMSELTEQNEKWNRLIDKHSIEEIKKTKKGRSMIIKGIPIFLKYRLWKYLIYKRINVDYEILSTQVCGYEHQIHVDVQRTLRKHILFYDTYGIGQCRLFKVLVAYANYEPAIGYCQGMSSFVGLILMYFPEREAFDMLVNIIEVNQIHGLFDKNLSLLPHILDLQEKECVKLIPNIYKHMLANGVDASMYMFGWYLTLFSRFDIELTLRIWDLFLFYGFKIFPIFGAAILKAVGIEILELAGESLIEFIGGLDNYKFDVEKIMKWVYKNL
ncbi:USP6 N-terminal-like protein [Astathelohania contejeani]|uniref:USP6 N-terminal-like protein n=1 Tax=Astathelohania contejeani TaxID=164912 RepID=A0ABQ7I2Y0_9MICR|nr:USP6 N-terminal-like protein [Thelohania contejeani]